jgi:hypothetical protein
MIYIDRDDLSNSSSPRRSEATSGVRLESETSHTENEQSETEITTVVCHIHPYILVSILMAGIIALITVIIRTIRDNTKNVYNTPTEKKNGTTKNTFHEQYTPLNILFGTNKYFVKVT